MEFLGLRTLIYRVSDLQKAKTWYTKFLDTKPYFDEDFYVGYNVGGFEMGLQPMQENLKKGNNMETYMGVNSISKSLDRALRLGAILNTDIQEVGGNIRVATIKDPFGNIFGLIENPSFKTEL